MEVIHERCAGLDVHKETVVGCLGVREHGEVRHEVRRFATATAGCWSSVIGCGKIP
jgi:transposase